jgi:hypothetical protein
MLIYYVNLLFYFFMNIWLNFTKIEYFILKIFITKVHAMASNKKSKNKSKNKSVGMMGRSDLRSARDLERREDAERKNAMQAPPSSRTELFAGQIASFILSKNWCGLFSFVIKNKINESDLLRYMTPQQWKVYNTKKELAPQV